MPDSMVLFFMFSWFLSLFYLVSYLGAKLRRIIGYTKNKLKICAVFLCRSVAYLQLWLSPKILPFGNKKKNERTFLSKLSSAARTDSKL